MLPITPKKLQKIVKQNATQHAPNFFPQSAKTVWKYSSGNTLACPMIGSAGGPGGYTFDGRRREIPTYNNVATTAVATYLLTESDSIVKNAFSDTSKSWLWRRTSLSSCYKTDTGHERLPPPGQQLGEFIVSSGEATAPRALNSLRVMGAARCMLCSSSMLKSKTHRSTTKVGPPSPSPSTTRPFLSSFDDDDDAKSRPKVGKTTSMDVPKPASVVSDDEQPGPRIASHPLATSMSLSSTSSRFSRTFLY